MASGTEAGLPPRHWSKGVVLNVGSIVSASSASVLTLAFSAPSAAGAFIGKRLYLHATGEDREIVGYTSNREAELFPPLHVLPTFADTDAYIVYSDRTEGGAGLDYDFGRPEIVAYVEHLDMQGPVTLVNLVRSGSSISAGGLTATYYGISESFGQPIHVAECSEAGRACPETIDFSVSPTNAKVPMGGFEDSRIGTSMLSLGNTEYSVRWSGFVKGTTAATYEFTTELLGYTGANNNTERIRLWIDDRMVVDQWNSLSSGAPQGTFAIAGHQQSYPIKIYYKQTSLNASSGLRIKWKRDQSSLNTSSVVVPSNRLFPLDGTLIGARTFTASGKYRTEISLAQGGGLFATYYSDAAATVPSWSGTSTSIHQIWTSSSTEIYGWRSAQWTGLIRFGGGAPESSDGTDVTIGVEVRGADERVRVDVDGIVVIDWIGTGPFQDVNPAPLNAGPNGGVILSSPVQLQVGRYHYLKVAYWVGEQERPLIR